MTDTTKTFKQTYPCLTCLALKGEDKDVKTRLRRQFSAMHVIPQEQESLFRFLKEQDYVSAHLSLNVTAAEPKGIKDTCHEEFLSSMEPSASRPCDLCEHYQYYKNTNFDKERRLLSRMFRSPRGFMKHIPKIRASVFKSCYMFVYTGGTDSSRYLVIPLFQVLAKALIDRVNDIEFSDESDQDPKSTLLKLQGELTKRFRNEKYPFLYSELEPVIRSIVSEFGSTRYDLDNYESLCQIYKELTSKKKAPAGANAGDTDENFIVLQRPWEVPVPGLILLGKRKIRPFSKEDLAANGDSLKQLIGNVAAIKAHMNADTPEFFDATCPCSGPALEAAPKPQDGGSEPLSYQTEIPASAAKNAPDGHSSASGESKEKAERQSEQKSFFADSGKVPEPKKNVSVTAKTAETTERPQATDVPELDPLISTGYEKPEPEPAAKDSLATGSDQEKSPQTDASKTEPSGAGSATADNASESKPESPYAAYAGGIRRAAYPCSRTPLGVLDLTEESKNGLFPVLDGVEDTIDFLRHIMPHEEWFAIEYAFNGQDSGIALLGGNGYHTAFIKECDLTAVICRLLFKPASPKVIYTQSLPYLYSRMVGHGISSTHHLVSLPALFYANEEWLPFSAYPDFDLFEELKEDAPSPSSSTVMDLLGHYEKICQALTKRNEDGSRRVRAAASRFRHYELALGTMKGTDRYPGCAWYPKEATDDEIRSCSEQGRFFEIRLTSPITRYGKPLCDEEHFYFLMGVVSRIQRECFSKYPVTLITMTNEYLVYYLPTKREDDRAYFENLAAGEFVHVKRDMKTDPPSIRVASRPIQRKDNH